MKEKVFFMGDRYLYKAKRVDNGEWAQGYYAVIGGVEIIIKNQAEKYYVADEEKNSSGNEIVPIRPATLCQCTGLKDKNDALIWENDIVFVTDEDECIGGLDTGMGQIMLLKGLWYIDGRVQNGLYDVFYEGFNIETIGNKFDNPELLGVEG